MHYYLYEIKNTINGKIYVGVHKTKSLDDGYMGSGKVISNAIRKYGIEHFTKTILETFENSADMFAREKEVVNDEFLACDNSYNLRQGGNGGWDYVHLQQLNRGFTGKKHSTQTRSLLSDIGKNRVITDLTKEKLSANSWSKSNPDQQKIHAANAAKIGNDMRNDAVIEKISSTMTKVWESRLEITCPFCGTTGRGGTMKRWHFDKCKNKGSFI